MTFSGRAVACPIELARSTTLRRFVGSGMTSGSAGPGGHALAPVCSRGRQRVELWTEGTWQGLEYSEKNVC